jgi:hypothetical protein
MTTKICPKCEVEKTLDEFGKCKKARDDLQFYCKRCASLLGMQWALNNKDRNSENQRRSDY